MKTILILCTAFLFTACACTKNSKPILNEPLPPATQTGANTFGCTLNGQVFVPNLCYCSVMPEFAMAVYGYYRNTENSSVRIFANRGSNIKNMLFISLYLYKCMKKKEETTY